MVDRPILFSAPMIRALLEGRKTQTRQLGWRGDYICPECNGQGLDAIHCPVCKGAGWAQKPSLWQKVKPGDRLWVRETFGYVESTSTPAGNPMDPYVVYRETDLEPEGFQSEPFRWRPSIHMPRWASRLTLCVTDVRRERLQDISKDDAKAEGCGLYVCGHGWITREELRADPGYSVYLNARNGFEDTWNSIYGPDSWNQNPEVVALTFTVHKANIDQLGEQAA